MKWRIDDICIQLFAIDLVKGDGIYEKHYSMIAGNHHTCLVKQWLPYENTVDPSDMVACEISVSHVLVQGPNYSLLKIPFTRYFRRVK